MMEEMSMSCMGGGFAMGILGVPRNTIDIDFLVSSEEINKIEHLMLSLGYKKVFSSENASLASNSL